MTIDLLATGRHGRAPALIEVGRTLTHAETAALVEEEAARLSGAGVTDGTRVLLRCPRRAATAIASMALLAVGAAPVPVSADAPEAEVARLAAAAGAAWCLTDGALVGTAATPRPGPPAGLVMQSSGSMGTPRLVLRTAEQVAAAIALYVGELAVGSDDRAIALVPLEHNYGFLNVLLGTLVCGGAVVFPAAAHPRAVLNAVRAHGATMLASSPSFLELLAREAAPSETRLRVAVAVGSSLSLRLHEAATSALGVSVWSSYGTSEAGMIALNRTGTARDGRLALGTPCAEVAVELVDETGAPTGAGSAGELVARSAAVAHGYDGGDGASRIAHGAFWSGDLAYAKDGVLFFAGRRKLLVDAGAHKVDPFEVEEVLRQHRDILDAAVVAVPGPQGTETVKALVVSRVPLTVVDITDHCARALSAYKVPRLVEFRRHLPRTALGKLQRGAL